MPEAATIETTKAPKAAPRTGLKSLATPIAQATAAKAPAKELPPVLKLSDFQISEFAVAKFNIWLPVGCKFDECLRPEFWAQCAHKLQKQAVTSEPDKAGATIEVRTRDHNFYAELYVVAVRQHGLEVKILREPVYFDLPEIPDNDQYRAQWAGAKSGWDIIRKSDGAVCGDGANIKTRKAAKEWIERMT